MDLPKLGEDLVHAGVDAGHAGHVKQRLEVGDYVLQHCTVRVLTASLE